MRGNGNTCGECLLLAHGNDPWNSCVGHGEGQGAGHSIPVGDELVKDPRRVSEKVHVEIRDGRSSATQYGTRLVESRLGVPLRETWGWKPLLHTPSSGAWVLPGALQSLGFLDLLGVAASWVSRSTYRTAWAVCPWSGCQYSYSYGYGPAIGPHTGRGCFRYLVSVWRAIAPL